MAIPIAPFVAQFWASFPFKGICVCVHGGESQARNAPRPARLVVLHSAKEDGRLAHERVHSTGVSALGSGRLRTVVRNRTCGRVRRQRPHRSLTAATNGCEELRLDRPTDGASLR
jgi:hypothetical protein